LALRGIWKATEAVAEKSLNVDNIIILTGDSEEKHGQRYTPLLKSSLGTTAYELEGEPVKL